ncbi:uncharacterized protein BJ171DRAFT_514013 [Polychytrium aggregatum]|uniref:uncharacterized protein n=1 Tax=Polychytrium aggregatum TaxID=110093 RepID=UPI0022FF319C|nr:uncharacterized protein BJ171DRAFT_514013 [Polychytrium aggregatum]KAI9202421.1 hypothetical protein BJ171DRAFT_514013 [Polychytrium aggregatum]
MTESRRVIVTYADEGKLWSQMADEISSRMPLRNITWQNPMDKSRTIFRTIEALDVEFKRFSADIFPRQAPNGSVQNPFFVHLFLVNCEDMDLYKNQVRKQIQDWLNVIANKKSQEWLIVNVVPADGKKIQTPRFLGGGNVFEKIKSDFSMGKKDRFVQLKLGSTDSQESWIEFIAKLKEALVTSFNQQILQFEEDTRRLDSQRLMPGWNFCQYFIMKEALAYIFELMNLLGEALLVYDELEASFFQTMAEQGVPWIKKFGGTDPGDDSGDILNLKQKPYRDMISQTTISIFDFRIYMFARQCQILFRMNMPVEICRRSNIFIAVFGRTLEDYKVALVPNFCECWIYSACLNVIMHCQELVAVSSHSPEVVAIYEAYKGELLMQARLQLDRLGARTGQYLSIIHTTTPSKPTESSEAYVPFYDLDPEEIDANSHTLHLDEVAYLTNQELKNALMSTSHFDELYARITGRAITSFELTTRARTVNMLKCDIALLLFTRGRFQDAINILVPLAAYFKGHEWNTIHTMIVEKLSVCQKKLGRLTDFVNSCIHLITVNSELERTSHVLRSGGKGQLIRSQSSRSLVLMSGLQPADINACIDAIQQTAGVMETGLVCDDSIVFEPAVLSLVQELHEEDKISATVRIHSRLIKDICLSSVKVILDGPEGAQMLCGASDVSLEPGSNEVKLTNETVILPGLFTVSAIVLAIGKLQFRYNTSKLSKKKQTFRIYENHGSIKVNISIPDQVVYGELASSLTMRILTNSNAIEHGELLLASINGMILHYSKASVFRVSSCLNADDVPRERPSEIVGDNRISLPKSPANSLIEFSIPYTLPPDKAGQEDYYIKVTLPYSLADGSKRVYCMTEKVKILPPVGFSSSFNFASDSLFAQVQLIGLDSVPIRITDTTISVPRHYKCTEYPLASTTLVEQQKMTLFYRLEPIDVTSDSSAKRPAHGDKLQFALKYYYTREEIEQFILFHLEQELRANQMTKCTGFLTQLLKDHIFTQIDFHSYGLYNEVDVFPGMFSSDDSSDRSTLVGWLQDSVNMDDEGISSEILKFLQGFATKFQKITAGQVRESIQIKPRTLVYNFAPPVCHNIITSHLHLHGAESANGQYSVAQTIPCTLELKLKAWGKSDHSETEEFLDITIEALFDPNIWMLSGKRVNAVRLQMNLDEANEQTVKLPFALIPLTTGELPMPNFRLVNKSLSELDMQSKPLKLQLIHINSGEQVMILPREQSAQLVLEMSPAPESASA